MNCRKINILIAEDDPDDRFFIKNSIEKFNENIELNFVNDGEELLNYLENKDPYLNKKAFPHPSLIVLDLHMPKINGFEVLQVIKENRKFKNIPVVVLTTSNASMQVELCYDLKANSFIPKPNTIQEYQETIQNLLNYWLLTAGIKDQINTKY